MEVDLTGAPGEAIAAPNPRVRAPFIWYNHQYHHTGIGLMTLAKVNYGPANQIDQKVVAE